MRVGGAVRCLRRDRWRGHATGDGLESAGPLSRMRLSTARRMHDAEAQKASEGA
jgi:hypothetical protein